MRSCELGSVLPRAVLSKKWQLRSLFAAADALQHDVEHQRDDYKRAHHTCTTNPPTCLRARPFALSPMM